MKRAVWLIGALVLLIVIFNVVQVQSSRWTWNHMNLMYSHMPRMMRSGVYWCH